MALVTEVSDSVYQIDVKFNFMYCLSYLVVGEGSVLIDPGSTTQSEIVLKAIEEELKFDLARISHIIPTHLHLDHSGGAGYMAERLPQAQVLVYERYSSFMVDPTELVEANKLSFGTKYVEPFGPTLPVPEGQILKMAGGEKIDLDDRTLEIIYSRGHANHHLSLYDSKSKGLFCGDALGMYFPEVDGVVIVCPNGFNLDLALEGIEQLRKTEPQLLFYAHEGVGRNPDRLMDIATKQLKDCMQIVSDATREGATPKQIEKRLQSYFSASVSPDLDFNRMLIGMTVGGYQSYLNKNGLI
ncbi:MAG: MBL fold metallo-hydrolase [Chloroflexota bacterium]|nr:MBL fold metallo-hydrolase [Chloroflexota bacterium]